VRRLALAVPIVIAASLLLAAVPGQAAFPGTNGLIAFQKFTSGPNAADIFTMASDGSGVRQLTANPADDETPRWSPDGTKIAFSGVQPGGRDIFVMNADGSGQVNLTNSARDDIYPAWSPDGTKIAFASAPGGESGGATEIYVMNADGSGQTPLTDTAAISGQNFYPDWSPDGTKIAFMSARSGQRSQIYVMNADGSGQAPVTNDPSAAINPSWSPDGTQIAFFSSRTGDTEIYAIGADGSGERQLTTSPGSDVDPAWSPDGTKIAFESGRDGNEEIYVMNADGSGQTRLTNDPSSQDRYPDWQVVPAAVPPPVLGQSVNVSVVSGTVLVKTGSTFEVLSQTRQIKVGSQLDTKAGVVRLVSAANKSGKTQSGDFGRGVFQVAQSKSAKAKGLTDLTLKGGNFDSCKASGKKAGAAAKKKKTIRSLFSKAKGKFRTKGRYSAASVRGTTWLVTDRCDGTLTSVKSGTVSVFDFKRKRTVKVKAGKSYLARASR
jgi:Tol biopolymer transport system component